jgi:hypothetical protein
MNITYLMGITLHPLRLHPNIYQDILELIDHILSELNSIKSKLPLIIEDDNEKDESDSNDIPSRQGFYKKLR